MDKITLNAYATYLKTRNDDLAKKEYERILSIAEKIRGKEDVLVDFEFTEALWNDFVNSKNLN